MAAVDPTAEPEADEDGNVPEVPRSTLRLIKRAFPGLDDEEDDEIDEEYMRALLGESDEDEDEEESNGGPSDPAKAKKQKQAAAIKKLLEAAQEEESEDEDMEDAKPKGAKSKKSKGKGKAVEESESEEDEEEDSDDDSEEGDLENFVICTLDTERVSTVCFYTVDASKVALTQSHANILRSTINSLLTSLSTTAKRSSSSSLVLTPSISRATTSWMMRRVTLRRRRTTMTTLLMSLIMLWVRKLAMMRATSWMTLTIPVSQRSSQRTRHLSWSSPTARRARTSAPLRRLLRALTI